MAEGDAEDRTEAATARQLQRAREEGRVPLSRDLPILAGLATASLMFMMAAPDAARRLALQLQPFLAAPHALPATRLALLAALSAGGRAAAPLIFAILVAGCAAVLLQTGFLLNGKALQPDLARLNPRRGLRRFTSLDGLSDLGKALLKLAVLGVVAWRTLRAELPGLGGLLLADPGVMPDRVLRALLRLLMLLIGAYAVLAALDIFWVRFRHARSLRMSREEVRQEAKETEGDPHVKGRLRKLRLARARKRMLAQVPKATVVITNPTHYAIALSYDRAKQSAPRVVAKGVDEVAARIRETAKEHGVPLVPNPPLARALYRVEVDAEIPAEHFQTVAEIIAYIWRLRGQARGAAR